MSRNIAHMSVPLGEREHVLNIVSRKAAGRPQSLLPLAAPPPRIVSGVNLLPSHPLSDPSQGMHYGSRHAQQSQDAAQSELQKPKAQTASLPINDVIVDSRMLTSKGSNAATTSTAIAPPTGATPSRSTTTTTTPVTAITPVPVKSRPPQTSSGNGAPVEEQKSKPLGQLTKRRSSGNIKGRLHAEGTTTGQSTGQTMIALTQNTTTPSFIPKHKRTGSEGKLAMDPGAFSVPTTAGLVQTTPGTPTSSNGSNIPLQNLMDAMSPYVPTPSRRNSVFGESSGQPLTAEERSKQRAHSIRLQKKHRERTATRKVSFASCSDVLGSGNSIEELLTTMMKRGGHTKLLHGRSKEREADRKFEADCLARWKESDARRHRLIKEKEEAILANSDFTEHWLLEQVPPVSLQESETIQLLNKEEATLLEEMDRLRALHRRLRHNDQDQRNGSRRLGFSDRGSLQVSTRDSEEEGDDTHDEARTGSVPADLQGKLLTSDYDENSNLGDDDAMVPLALRRQRRNRAKKTPYGSEYELGMSSDTPSSRAHSRAGTGQGPRSSNATRAGRNMDIGSQSGDANTAHDDNTNSNGPLEDCNNSVASSSNISLMSAQDERGGDDDDTQDRSDTHDPENNDYDSARLGDSGDAENNDDDQITSQPTTRARQSKSANHRSRAADSSEDMESAVADNPGDPKEEEASSSTSDHGDEDQNSDFDTSEEFKDTSITTTHPLDTSSDNNSDAEDVSMQVLRQPAAMTRRKRKQLAREAAPSETGSGTDNSPPTKQAKQSDFSIKQEDINTDASTDYSRRSSVAPPSAQASPSKRTTRAQRSSRLTKPQTSPFNDNQKASVSNTDGAAETDSVIPPGLTSSQPKQVQRPHARRARGSKGSGEDSGTTSVETTPGSTDASFDLSRTPNSTSVNGNANGHGRMSSRAGKQYACKTCGRVFSHPPAHSQHIRSCGKEPVVKPGETSEPPSPTEGSSPADEPSKRRKPRRK
eukprot:m.170009 g.170009  ORF g.170009 m.170009 type:complete len:986 (-) comp16484_c1_seq1:109-3066(-)